MTAELENHLTELENGQWTNIIFGMLYSKVNFPYL